MVQTMVTMVKPVKTPLVVVKHGSLPDDLQRMIRNYTPKTDLGRLVKRILQYVPADDAKELLTALTRCVVVESELSLRVIRTWESRFRTPGTRELIEDYGVVSRKVVTDNGVGFIVDAFQNLVELENMKYHGIGTGTTAESASQTALVTELTTQYNPDNTRATGSLTEGATANIFKTVGTNTLDSGTPAVTEHGIFSQAATGGGVLLDRSVFAAVNLDGTAGDGLQSTYQLTFNSGG
jgi:hypothetical protein